ncbi:hypothetical protein HX13_16000 [Chryseobacterium sp. P1-3]|uniref:Uncharacterized protein n=1 Tax=Chryseobacterium gallinarum TaxID=1324352 RepID=A0A0G3M1M7_CHRGL|nr:MULTISPECIES: hypothetical protein [Chryseobacterium]AKK72505.1 hypothetical protein OK18_07580 [Chryseobacterium gallinarum]KFF74009.1 hypothetical protein HX13_16000 [Chryseobacterium sp. P1-3]MCL8536113.1 hypothetical protein [Chryseobacterium gallinarum]
MKEFDIEKLERKNIYTVPDDLFENIQEKVMNDIKTSQKAPVFKLNWMYAAAASLALIFGATYVFNSDNDSVEKRLNSAKAYAINDSSKGEPKTEGELAYETLKSDLTSVENNNQTVGNQENNKGYVVKNTHNNPTDSPQPVKTVTKKEETRMNDYLDSFSNSEIAELASNSTQDVYLDLYN